MRGEFCISKYGYMPQKDLREITLFHKYRVPCWSSMFGFLRVCHLLDLFSSKNLRQGGKSSAWEKGKIIDCIEPWAILPPPPKLD